ncbi:MAG: cobyrinate a,c-diamide synthase [Pseudomonadota bacterium]
MVRSCPALFIAAPASGQGKTTVTAGLARLHARAGRRVRVFKCGPDFLDPQILAVASGAPVHNLDLWMCGEADAAARLYQAAGEADLVLVEGVMGLYDGEPSGAAIARRFGLPVLAVIDGAAMAQTFGAVALGLASYEAGLTFAGVLANGVGSAGHAALLAASLPPQLPWYGHLPRDADAALPERHLGLVQAQELEDLVVRLDRVADALAASAAARLPPAAQFAPQALPAPPPLLAGRKIAVARDAAFAFIYPANLATLAALGAEVVFFSPLADAALPECDALWLPGGYPELHGARLAGNRPMLDALRAHHARDKPTLAECGGMMALFDTLVDTQGARHRLAGIIPGEVAMGSRLAALGVQRLDFPEGALRGHTFHYSTAATPLAPALRARTPREGAGEAVYRCGRLTASYVHLYFPSNPWAVARLLG